MPLNSQEQLPLQAQPTSTKENLMKLLSTLFFSSAVAFAAIGNAASETVAVGWGESYTLETGRVLTFLHCAHDIELTSNYGYDEIPGIVGATC